MNNIQTKSGAEKEWEIWYEGDPNDAVLGKRQPQIHAGCIIDGHMHINSGACAPLPLIYSQFKMVAHVDPARLPYIKIREHLENLISLSYSDGISMQRLSTSEIGKRISNINKLTYANIKNSIDFCSCGEDGFESSKPPREKIDPPEIKNNDKENIASPMIIATMDMEHAHIAGYKGEMIYRGEKEDLFFYERSSGKEVEQSGKNGDKRVGLAHEYDKSKGLKLHRWKKQYDQTCEAIAKKPFQEIPLYFYDPRRWRYPSGTKMTDSMKSGSWDEPFNEIATAERTGLFIGFKMYPSLGHKPFDELCEFLPEFFDKCENDNLPILTHCSPGGIATHEMEFYEEFDAYKNELRNRCIKIQDEKVRKILKNKNRIPLQKKPGNDSHLRSDHMIRKYSNDLSDKPYHAKQDYFLKNYVHPEEWRKILVNFPDLKLCLAHFGGDEWRRGKKEDWYNDIPSEWILSIIDLTKKYNNVYTDISCFDLENSLAEGDGKVMHSLDAFLRRLDDERYKHLRDKIIFGTDWYLTLLTRAEGGAYEYYCRKMKYFLDKIDRTLWVRFTLINPWEFYGLGDEAKLCKMLTGLKLAKANKKTAQIQYEKFLSLKKEVKKLKEEFLKMEMNGIKTN